MVRFRDISIRSKLMVIIMATCCTALFLGGGALVVRYAASEQDKAAERLTVLAQVIGSNIAAAVSFDEPVAAGEILGALTAEPGILSARVFDSRGRLFARYGAESGTAGEGEPLTLAGFLFTRDSFWVATPIILDGEVVGRVAVVADLGPLRTGLLLDVAMLTAIILASGLAALVLSHHLQKIISAPITRLAETMGHVSRFKDYGVQVRKDGSDEIGALIDGFNDMLAQIDVRGEQLERRRRQLEDAHRIARLGNWEWDAAADRLELSPEARRILGIPGDCGFPALADFLDCIHPDDRQAVKEGLEASVLTGRALDLEHRLLGRDGERRFIHLRGELRPRGTGLSGSIQDVSERVWAEERIRIAANALEHTGDAIMITDPALRIVSVNRSFSLLTGYRQDELAGRRPDGLLAPRQGPAFFIGVWRKILSEGQWHGEIWGKDRDGEAYPLLTSISAVRDRAGKVSHYVFVGNDISHYKRHEANLEHQARHDALTGLPNRAFFEAELPRALLRAQRRGGRMGVMFIDLDHFKEINDTLGHTVGDLLLQSASARIKGCIRQSDLVARLGGDEFTVILDDLHEVRDGARIAEKIVEEMARPFELAGHQCRISASIGVGCYPDDGNDAERLLAHADAAMYTAKEEGRNGYRLRAGSGSGGAAPTAREKDRHPAPVR